MARRNELHDVLKHYDMTGGLNDGKIHRERCWPWKSKLNGKGHPIFSYDGKSYYGHRIVYHLFNSSIFPLDDPRIIRHVVCDNGICGNPDHMKPGSHQDNMNDAVAHARFGLTKEEIHDIIELLAMGDLTHQRIAERISYKHGRKIARSTVSDINTGRRNERRKEQSQ